MTQSLQQQLNTIRQAMGLANWSQVPELIEQARELVGDARSAADVYYLDAIACRFTQRYDDALQALDCLLTIRPDYGRGFQEQGYCWLAKQDKPRAADAFFRATRFNPALLPSWQQLLAVYHQQQQEKAAAMAQAQIDYLQSLPKPVLGGYDLMYEGELHKAEALCRQYLQSNKHQPDAMLLLAELGIKLSVYADAEFLLESCVELYPDNPRAGRAYLSLLSKLGKYETALKQAERLLLHTSDDVHLQVAKANALVGLGQLPAAIDCYQGLLESNPDRPAVWLALGHAYKALGSLEEAVAAYRKAAQFEPSLGDAYWSLANTKRYQFSDNEIALMSELEGHTNLQLDDHIHVLFALGKAYEDRQQYAESFAYYARGNALKLRTTQFDIAKTEQAIAAQKAACPADIFLQASGSDDPAPIFIVGLPRAGSTLLEQILASHPLVDGTMELHDILGIAAGLNGNGQHYPDVVASLTDSECKRLGEQYINQTRIHRQGAPYFIDKMPNNFVHIGLIKRILPNAKIVDARRDPFACCFSGFKQLFGEGQEFTYGLDEIGRYYRAYEDLMAHWDNVLPGQILRVQHEDLLADFETQVRRLLAYCHLPFDERCLRFYETERVIKTPSAEQVRQPLYSRDKALWREYSHFLSPLYKALGRTPQVD